VIHETAAVEASADIASEVEIGAYVSIGDDAVVATGAILDAGARIGTGVIVGPSAKIGANSVIAGGSSESRPTRVAEHAEIGAAAVVGPGVHIGHHAVVAPGTTVGSDVPPYAHVQGDSGRIVGYAGENSASLLSRARPQDFDSSALDAVSADGVRLVRAAVAEDLRGSLVAYEHDEQLPYRAARAYLVFDVHGNQARAEHAHRECHETLVCAAGSLDVLVDTGSARAQVRLQNPAVGLYLPPMTWRVIVNHSPGAVLMVLSSLPYDPDDYIRDYPTWEAMVSKT
jgi:acyl-[acyl carrier protein]--UDP-N-acetylglucosamine O-acyltransferase